MPKHESAEHKPAEIKSVEQELIIIAAIIIGLGILIGIAFYESGILTIVKTTLALAWLFLLPGYMIMLRWHNDLPLGTRLVIGIGFSTAILGIASYYAGLAGWNAQTHGFIIPAVIIALGILLEMLAARKE